MGARRRRASSPGAIRLDDPFSLLSPLVRRPTVQHNLVMALPLRLEVRAG
jgi:hypothetical protein